MPLDGDDVTGLVGTAVTAAVGLGVVKMTTDMVSGMADTNPKKCKKCGKLKSKCKCKKFDYGGELFDVNNWMKL